MSVELAMASKVKTGGFSPEKKASCRDFPCGVGDHPVNIFGAAEAVLVLELLCGRDVQAIEAAVGGDARVGVEDGADLGGFEGAGARDGGVVEVDGELFVGECDVAGDASGR